MNILRLRVWVFIRIRDKLASFSNRYHPASFFQRHLGLTLIVQKIFIFAYWLHELEIVIIVVEWKRGSWDMIDLFQHCILILKSFYNFIINRVWRMEILWPYYVFALMIQDRFVIEYLSRQQKNGVYNEEKKMSTWISSL